MRNFTMARRGLDWQSSPTCDWVIVAPALLAPDFTYKIGISVEKDKEGKLREMWRVVAPEGVHDTTVDSMQLAMQVAESWEDMNLRELMDTACKEHFGQSIL